MKQLFPISIFLLLTVSCTSNEKYSGINTNKYDSLEIKLGDAFVPLRAKYQHFDTDSGEYLSMINVGQNNIETINLVSQKWSPPIHLNKEGPNGIGIHNGFRILTLDCLIVASIPPNLRFLDFEGNLKRSIPIKDPENSVNYLTSDNRLPFFLVMAFYMVHNLLLKTFLKPQRIKFRNQKLFIKSFSRKKKLIGFLFTALMTYGKMERKI